MSEMHPIRGLAAGLLAGCAASWVMNNFQQRRPVKSAAASNDDPSNAGQETKSRKTQQTKGLHQSDDADENATVKTAQRISREVFKHNLTSTEKKLAGPAVHYAYGSLVGALYGGLAEFLPGVSAGMGLPFGFALWVLGDEIAVPALGLAKAATEYPPEVHADALAAHLMYGVTTDMLRRVLRHVV
jgi:putative membrane protein